MDTALQACKCSSKARPPTTITVTKTVTAGAIVTVRPYSTTIPSVTSTSTNVLVVFETSTKTATVRDYTTLTDTLDITATKTATATITSTPPAATETVFAVSYSKVVIPEGDCYYYAYYTYDSGTSNNPDNNYQEGVRQCEAQCTSDPTCLFFFFVHIDPSRSQGAVDETHCYLGNQPYDSSFFECGSVNPFHVNNFNVAYNKSPQGLAGRNTITID